MKNFLRLLLLASLALVANVSLAQSLISGTLSATNASVYIPLTQTPNMLMIQVGGSGSWTLAVETSPDGLTWTPLNNSLISPVGNTGAWGSGVKGYFTVPVGTPFAEVVMTSYSGGSASVALTQVSAPYISPPLVASAATDLVTAANNSTALAKALQNASSPSAVLVAPTFDNKATGSTAGAATVTISYPTFGQNRFLAVAIQYHDASTPVSGVTYGGVALTLGRTSPSASAGMDVFYIKNASIGASSTPSVVVTNSNSSDAEAITVVSMMGVNTVTFGTTATGTGTSATATQASAANHVVLDFVGSINGTATSGSANVAAPSPMATSPLYATQSQVTQGTVQGSDETLVGATSTSIAWTVPSGAWAIVPIDLTGFSYQGAGASAGVVYIPGAPGGNSPYYFSLPAGNNYACVEASYLRNVKLLVDPGVSLKLANNANCYLLFAYGCDGFQIQGGNLDGNLANETAGSGYYSGYAGTNWMGAELWFDSCTDTLLSQVNFTNCLKQAIFGTNDNRFKIQDIWINGGQTVQFDCGCQNISVNNLVGNNTNDTLLAIAPEDYVAYNVRGGGNVLNVTASGIRANNPTQEAVRIVGGNAVYGAYGGYISHVSGVLPTGVNGITIIDDATDVRTTGTICDGYVFDDVKFDSQFNDSASPFVMTATHAKNVVCKNFHCWNYAADTGVSCFILTGSIQGLRIETSDMPPTAGFQGNFVLCESGLSLANDLTLQGCVVNFLSTTNGAVVGLVSGCSVGKINLLSDTFGLARQVVFSNGAQSISCVGCNFLNSLWAFSMNQASGNSFISSSGNDFTGMSGPVYRNATSGGNIAVKGSSNLYPSGFNPAQHTAAQTNMSIGDPSCKVDGAILTPVFGDLFYNTNAGFGAGVGLYAYGTSATRISA